LITNCSYSYGGSGLSDIIPHGRNARTAMLKFLHNGPFDDGHISERLKRI